jgi:hypothetical protein
MKKTKKKVDSSFLMGLKQALTSGGKKSREFFISESLWWGTVFFFILLSLGQFERVDLPFLPAFYLHDLVIIGFIAKAFVSQKFLLKSIARKIFKPSFLVILFIGWVVVGWINAFLTHGELVTGLLYFARLGLYGVGGYVLFELVKSEVIPRSAVRVGIFLFGFFLFYFGVMQYFFFPDTRMLFFLGWDDHYFRLISTLFDPGFTGLLFTLSFVFWQKQVGLKWSWPLLVGVLLTYSRASYLVAVISLVLLIMLSFTKNEVLKLLFFVFTLFMFFVAIPFLPHPGGEGVNLARTSTIEARQKTWTEDLLTLRGAELFVGKGLFTPVHLDTSEYADENHALLPDSWLATILVGTGGVGLAVFLVLLFNFFLRHWKTHPYFIIGVLAVLFHGLFNNSLFYPFVVIFLLAWWSID